MGFTLTPPGRRCRLEGPRVYAVFLTANVVWLQISPKALIENTWQYFAIHCQRLAGFLRNKACYVSYAIIFNYVFNLYVVHLFCCI